MAIRDPETSQTLRNWISSRVSGRGGSSLNSEFPPAPPTFRRQAARFRRQTCVILRCVGDNRSTEASIKSMRFGPSDGVVGTPARSVLKLARRRKVCPSQETKCQSNVMVGGEFQWGRRENNSDGFHNDGYKLQFSFKYNFTRRVGGWLIGTAECF
jgi:hypothetical protein